MTSVSILPALEAPLGYRFTGIKAVPLAVLSSVAWLLRRPQRVVQPWDTSQHSVVSPSLGASKLWQERAGAALPLDICAGGQTSSRALVVSWECHWHNQERCLLTVDPTTFHPFCSRVDIDCSQSCFVPSGCPLEHMCQNRALPTSWCPPSLDVSLVWSGLSKFL